MDGDEVECRECGHPGGGHNLGCRIHHRIVLDEVEQLRDTIRAFGRGDIVPITDKDAEIEQLRAALEKATEKLQIFRSQTDGQYVGGMEYTALMKMIAEAVRAPEQKADGK